MNQNIEQQPYLPPSKTITEVINHIHHLVEIGYFLFFVLISIAVILGVVSPPPHSQESRNHQILVTDHICSDLLCVFSVVETKHQTMGIHFTSSV